MTADLVVKKCLTLSTAIKNTREGTRSPRTGHELKRTYEMMEGARALSGREAAPFEGNEVSTESTLFQ